MWWVFVLWVGFGVWVRWFAWVVGSCFNDSGLCVLCYLVFVLACCAVVSVCLVDASCGGVVLIVLCCIILCL